MLNCHLDLASSEREISKILFILEKYHRSGIAIYG